MATTRAETDFEIDRISDYWKRGKGDRLQWECESDEPGDWTEWTEHLLHKSARRSLLEEFSTSKRSSPLQWGLTTELSADSIELLNALGRFSRRGKKGSSSKLTSALEAWIGRGPDCPDRMGLALESIAWCHAMPNLASILPAAPWRQLLDTLLEIISDSKAVELAEPATQQLFTGELPLALACTFPEFRWCRELYETACRSLSNGIVEITDGQGFPMARHLGTFRLMLASWTRCQQMSEACNVSCFHPEAKEQFEFAFRQAIRLRRKDGSQFMAPPAEEANRDKDLFRAALRLIEDPDDKALGRFTFPTDGDRKRRVPKSLKPCYHSEWSEAAILRTGWSPKSSALAVMYDSLDVECELTVGGEPIWSGAWDTKISINEQTQKLDAGWEEVCWYCDDEVVYMELETQLRGKWKLERQFLLGREDQFLFIADALLGCKESEIRYEASLPLGENIVTNRSKQSRETSLIGKRPLAMAMPLAAPEWRCESGGMEIEPSDDGNLTFSSSAKASNLYVPMFFDLDRRRFRNPLTWRQLTVAEHLEIQPRDVAAGYRVQAGMQQWLIYRSLSGKGNRTVLGQNFYNEFYVGRFGVDGECHELVEIE